MLAFSAAAFLGSSHAVPDEGGRFVFVFLRGGLDGLSALVPYADPQYRSLRPHIAIARPDGTAAGAVRLDSTFGLHPALAPLQSLWEQGCLTFVPNAGLGRPERSHFEAQKIWELGASTARRGATGWLNGAASLHSPGNQILLGAGERNPEILRGAAVAQVLPPAADMAGAGLFGDASARTALRQAYAQDPQLQEMMEQAADARLARSAAIERMAAVGGLVASDAGYLAALMRQAPALRLGYLGIGGWDTHADQGTLTGPLARRLAHLADALVVLRRELQGPRDLIVVASEFGRTVRENGTKGTDHGHGNPMLLIGNAVNGGRWHGEWQGLAAGGTDTEREMPVFHDFRRVLALALESSVGFTPEQTDRLFPRATALAAPRGLFRST